MSSSSDIEKLFDHFGGDASAYQEIGRENEARSARTRWPLLVTLDLTQPAIPAIGQRREARAPAPMSEALTERPDTTPKDAASVTRAKAPLFTRSHRRDIPPVVVASVSTEPKGASRFGALEANDDQAAQATPAAPAVRVDPKPAVVAQQVVPDVLVAPVTSAAPAAQSAPPVTPSWAQAPAPARAYSSAPAAPAAPAFSTPLTQTRHATPTAPPAAATPVAYTAPALAPAPSSVSASPSILGKLFAAQAAPAPAPRPAAHGESAPLQSVFDRLRGTSAQTATAPGAAAPATPNSWLTNGPRRS
ncbi:cellulose biosynthesis protein BcsP [Paraburkholderia sp. BCC1884]|uniref:cellulose biosynthesis protein BcsP n=1 Tax=Paraburkholderia sp. BCC1884 TaxID=2562668 RepID=UPI00118294BC|nr:cellulose biosynthesis protein BcsP [Paraburkholderia sp. BCC1884]